jgi:hypothetical protein
MFSGKKGKNAPIQPKKPIYAAKFEKFSGKPLVKTAKSLYSLTAREKIKELEPLEYIKKACKQARRGPADRYAGAHRTGSEGRYDPGR